MRLSTILSAADKIVADLNYLCSIIESPDPEFTIGDAVTYSTAVVTLSNQLNFILEEISNNDLTEDEEHVKISEEEVWILNSHTEAAEDAIKKLEESCGISLVNN